MPSAAVVGTTSWPKIWVETRRPAWGLVRVLNDCFLRWRPKIRSVMKPSETPALTYLWWIRLVAKRPFKFVTCSGVADSQLIARLTDGQ
ncbi:unannotated protein [freshwater metagenome]|uniref:Unannotated protein n=1 Tax=freshwater metagenome TaxID=449393 RepID=A0A6J6WSD7_9ZZZZ